MERAFRTLKDRLPKELRWPASPTIAAANRFIPEAYLPDYNAQFAIAAEQPGSAFVPAREPSLARDPVLQEERMVANDNTVR